MMERRKRKTNIQINMKEVRNENLLKGKIVLRNICRENKPGQLAL